MSEWRRFELGGLLGSYFEIRVDGAELRVKIGSGGRNAREQVRPQPSPDAARAENERLIAAHLAKGYVEAAPHEQTARQLAELARERAAERARLDAEREEREARAAEEAIEAELASRRGVVEICANPALEAQCEAAAEDDAAPWSVYADWLAERGDPRGTIAGHELRGDHKGAADLLMLHREALCGFDNDPPAVTYRHGFARGLAFGNPTDYGEDVALGELVGAVAHAPIARFVDELRTGLTGFGSDNSWQPVLAALVGSPLGARLRTLRFDNYDYDDCMMHWVQIGDLSGLAELPQLEAIHVRGDNVTWGSLALPRLRRFVRESCTLGRAELAQILAAPWPALEHLELWFGSRNYGVDITVDDLAPLREGAPFSRLGHVGFVNCDLLDELVPALARSRLLPRLHSLDLSMGTLAYEGAALLVRHAPAFRHLASIELADNFLAPDDAARITAVLDNVVIGPQRDLAADDDNGPAARYVAEYE